MSAGSQAQRVLAIPSDVRGGLRNYIVGEVALANGERVFVTSLVSGMNADTRASVERLRSVRVIDADANPIKTGVMGFGAEPNPDADDGTHNLFALGSSISGVPVAVIPATLRDLGALELSRPRTAGQGHS